MSEAFDMWYFSQISLSAKYPCYETQYHFATLLESLGGGLWQSVILCPQVRTTTIYIAFGDHYPWDRFTLWSLTHLCLSEAKSFSVPVNTHHFI